MATNHTDLIRNSAMIAFKGRKHILSNFYPCSIFYKGRWFNCVEQVYQWEKATFHKHVDIVEGILMLKNPYEQKSVTKQIKVSEEWIEKRVYYMKQILQAKLKCVPEYKQLLLNSKGVIVEAVVGNYFWSCGLSKSDVYKESDWTGQNMLGKLHMELREELQTTHSIITAVQNQLQNKLQCEPHCGIEHVSVDMDNVTVTVYAKHLKKAYAFTDGFSIPRKVVRVIIGTTCHNI